MSYRQGLGIGALAVSLGSALYCVQVWLYNCFVDDSLRVTVRQIQADALAAQRNGAEFERSPRSTSSCSRERSRSSCACS